MSGKGDNSFVVSGARNPTLMTPAKLVKKKHGFVHLGRGFGAGGHW